MERQETGYTGGPECLRTSLLVSACFDPVFKRLTCFLFSADVPGPLSPCTLGPQAVSPWGSSFPSTGSLHATSLPTYIAFTAAGLPPAAMARPFPRSSPSCEIRTFTSWHLWEPRLLPIFPGDTARSRIQWPLQFASILRELSPLRTVMLSSHSTLAL